jgi:peptidoglycan L-alanyl-D-glutamate endopeptidase CwlK
MGRSLDELHPDLRDRVVLLLEQAKAHGILLVVVQGFRSMEEQALIYAKGRTRPGEPCRHLMPPRVRDVGKCREHPFGATVTNAPPGHSWHEAGRAVDLAFRTGSKGVSWTGPWESVGAMAEAVGLQWGGRWKSPDRPHVELRDPHGLTAAILEHEDRLA